MDVYNELMSRALAICRQGIEAGQSPFGAVIAAASGEVIATAHNTVRLTCDPTAHAEINAVRAACHKLGTIDLSGHLMAATCEPCPMCACAIHWARLDAVIFGAGIEDAARVGFRELSVGCRALFDQGGSGVRVVEGAQRAACLELFGTWRAGPNPSPY